MSDEKFPFNLIFTASRMKAANNGITVQSTATVKIAVDVDCLDLVLTAVVS
jgi:hypothetical protein